ncbi:hypothetical protein HA402_012365 [Bradysia odoriphaga]|uniref:uncharacterized protein LOC119068684 n=1 Tax=Bradysia coprophila TaxID=38358 RepID=UPI00187D8D38|nr:uncharacterized protein LOC119068684 [Bradysia coprophila]KAG4065687.1 hypothetical protein HA402_012365 [Bradysia odoriphaga]
MTPFDDFAYLVNNVFLLGEEPTIEDFILLIGTVVAFIAFILWCCFPIHPKENNGHQQFACKSLQHSLSSQQIKNGVTNGGAQLHYGVKNDHSYHCCG